MVALQPKEELGLMPGKGIKRGFDPEKKITFKPIPRAERMPSPVIQTGKQMATLLEVLLEPVQEIGGGGPYELTEEYLRRKRKRHGKSH